MHSFSNNNCLVCVRHCSGDIIVNDIDKISIVMETNEGTILENNRVLGGGCG